MDPINGTSPLTSSQRRTALEREDRRAEPDVTFTVATPADTAESARQVPGVDRPEQVADKQREQAEAEAAREARREAEAAARAEEQREEKVTVSFNAEAGRFVYQQRDPRTDDVVWEYPKDYILERMAERREERRGTVDETT